MQINRPRKIQPTSSPGRLALIREVWPALVASHNSGIKTLTTTQTTAESPAQPTPHILPPLIHNHTPSPTKPAPDDRLRRSRATKNSPATTTPPRLPCAKPRRHAPLSPRPRRHQNFITTAHLIRIGQLHDQPGRHVEEGERAGDLLVLEQAAVARLVAVDLEVDQVHIGLHFVYLNLHPHRHHLVLVPVVVHVGRGRGVLGETRGGGAFLQFWKESE
jgi:hypothetical protein